MLKQGQRINLDHEYGKIKKELDNGFIYEIAESITEDPNIILESIETELDYLYTLGYRLLDRYDIYPYSLLLIQGADNVIDVAITRDQAQFTTFDSQVKRQPSELNADTHKNLISKLKEWLQRYGELSIGSFNKKRSKKYHNILTRLGFKVGSIEINHDPPELPASYDFRLSLH